MGEIIMKMPIELIAACQMFLIPSTILFGALGVASTEGLKTLIAVMGSFTSAVWLIRLWLWDGLSTTDHSTVLVLAGIFVTAWLGSFLVHCYYGFTYGWTTAAVVPTKCAAS
jgi:hypothetical protein